MGLVRKVGYQFSTPEKISPWIFQTRRRDERVDEFSRASLKYYEQQLYADRHGDRPGNIERPAGDICRRGVRHACERAACVYKYRGRSDRHESRAGDDASEDAIKAGSSSGSKPVTTPTPKPAPAPIVFAPKPIAIAPISVPVVPVAIVVASASVENSSSQQLFVAVKGIETQTVPAAVTTTSQL